VTLNFCVRYERHTLTDISPFGSEHRDLRHPFHVEWFLSDISTFGRGGSHLKHVLNVPESAKNLMKFDKNLEFQEVIPNFRNQHVQNTKIETHFQNPPQLFKFLKIQTYPSIIPDMILFINEQHILFTNKILL